MTMAGFQAAAFQLAGRGQGRASSRLNRPERKNPLTFESYAELRDTFRALAYADDVKAVVFGSNGGNFCSGGDVHDIIGPLLEHGHEGPARLHPHDRRSGQGDARLPASRSSPRSTASASAPAPSSRMASRHAARHAGRPRPRSCSPASGLPAATWAPAPCCRASSARAAPPSCSTPAARMSAEEGERWGFFNRLVAADALESEALALAQQLADGPTFAHGMTKTQLNQEWSMALDQAIEAEAQAQAICMQTQRFRARLRRLRRQGEAACSRGIEMADTSFLDWPFFERAPRAGREARRMGATQPRRHRSSTTSMPPAASWWRSSAATAGWRRPRRTDDGAPLDVRTLCLDARDAGAP